MGMHNMFATDSELEKKGVIVEYGDFRITLARAGGANKKYFRMLNQITKPYRRAIDSDSMDPELQMKVMQEVYISSVILNWEVLRDGEWVKGIDPPRGEDPTGVETFNKENILRAFEVDIGVPELFDDIRESAGKALLYKVDIEEVEIKN